MALQNRHDVRSNGGWTGISFKYEGQMALEKTKHTLMKH